MKKFSDLHTHTLASHGKNTVQEMYAAAREKNLRHIGFSEHSPLPPGFHCALYSGDLDREFPEYADQVLKLKANTADPDVLLGIELDWLPSQYPLMKELVEKWPFDYVLGSLHYMDGYSISNLETWKKWRPGQERYGRFAGYYHEMAGMAKSGLIQIASHPDFIKLNANEDFQRWLNTKESRDAIVFALESLASNDVAMEINSAGLRNHLKEPYPGPVIMKLAKEAGVKITFGSDAHNCADVGCDIDRLHVYAAAFGFNSHLVYVQREPEELPLLL